MDDSGKKVFKTSPQMMSKNRVVIKIRFLILEVLKNILFSTQ